ncbi:MAG: UDP-N-acetylmuramoyl-tripeptide--D-alanyl-D-alanine ligase [Candidatus Omnitrophica bacterium]|nr:UDP-N-acetylmuramoyl-tripeptide--D-alanyl-D-alanine ligase [Candidatus Omnitrophota bacterium]
MFKVNELLKATKGKLISGKMDTPVKAISIDTRTIKPYEAFIAIKGENYDGHNFIKEAVRKGAACIIRERRVGNKETTGSLDNRRKIVFIEVKNTVTALGDIARFQRKKFTIPVIAVTGSNGKTTTKEMIACVLSKKFKVLKNLGTKNNQIGLSLTLLNLDSSYDFAVLELGTNHPGEIDYLAKICLPNIGVITNIGPAHLEYLDDFNGVLREKCSLLDNLEAPRIAILNADDPLLKNKISRKMYSKIFTFGIKNRCDFRATGIKNFDWELDFLAKQKFRLKTPGYYNIYNALASIAVGRIFGMAYTNISKALANFAFPQSRLNLLELNKVKFIDDTYNANPFSLKEALDVLDNFDVKGRKIFIMGDMFELGSERESFHREVGRKVGSVCDTFITVGKLSKLAASAAELSGFDMKNIFICETCAQARDILFNKVIPKKDDIVLVKGSRLMKMEEVFKGR